MYRAAVNAPDGHSVMAVPSFLKFESIGQKISFQVVMKWDGSVDPNNMQGELKWVSDKHEVHSPIVLPCSQVCVPQD